MIFPDFCKAILTNLHLGDHDEGMVPSLNLLTGDIHV